MTWSARLDRRASAWWILAGLAASSGCTVRCPDGEVEADGRCVPATLIGDEDDGGLSRSDTEADIPPSDALRLDVGTERVRLRPSLSVNVPVEVTGGAANDDPITIDVHGLPAGVRADSLSLPPGGSGTLMLTAAADAAPTGPTPIVVRGRRGDEIDEVELSLVLAGASGSAVVTFGTEGRVTVPLAAEIALTPRLLAHDGGFVVAGRASGSESTPFVPILRYSETGTLDTEFGAQGHASDTGSPSLVAIFALAMQGENILALGTSTASAGSGTTYSLHLRSFTAGGRTNPQFGVSGNAYVTATTAPSSMLIAGMVAGTRGIYVHVPSAVYAYRLVGTRDMAFGENGTVPFEEGGVIGLLARRDHGVLVFESGSSSTIIRALDTIGAPALDFGVDGSVQIPFTAIALSRWDEAGRLTLPVHFGDGATGLLRIDAEGNIAEDFGEDGTVVVGSNSSDQVFAAYPLTDGSTLAVGMGGLVRRVDSAGEVDPEFGIGGEINLGVFFATSIVVDEERGILTYFAPSGLSSSLPMILGQVWL